MGPQTQGQFDAVHFLDGGITLCTKNSSALYVYCKTLSRKA